MAHQNAPKEEHNEVGILCYLIGLSVPLAKISQHDANMHSRIADLGDEEPCNDMNCVMTFKQHLDNAADAQTVMNRHIDLK